MTTIMRYLKKLIMAIFPFLFTRKADVAPAMADVEVDSDIDKGYEAEASQGLHASATVEDILGTGVSSVAQLSPEQLRNLWMHGGTKAGTPRRRTR